VQSGNATTRHVTVDGIGGFAKHRGMVPLSQNGVSWILQESRKSKGG